MAKKDLIDGDEERTQGSSYDKIFFYVLTIGSILFFVWLYLTTYYDKQDVLKHYGKTVGWVTNYFDRHGSESGNGRSITYAYKVGNKTYSRNVYTHAIFQDCDQVITDKCKLRRFWVIYSIQDTSSSLISFESFFYDGKRSDFPDRDAFE